MVFIISITIVAIFAIWGAVAPDQMAAAANAAYNFSIHNFGWFYLLATLFFLIFTFYLAFSRFGGFVWETTMMNRNIPRYPGCRCYSAQGWGSGLSTGEWLNRCPITYLRRRHGRRDDRSSSDLHAVFFFHWGLHPWAIYAVIGLTLAYFQFRKGYKGLISSAFIPLLGRS